jgi:hypothetical protein
MRPQVKLKCGEVWTTARDRGDNPMTWKLQIQPTARADTIYFLCMGTSESPCPFEIILSSKPYVRNGISRSKLTN